jgi:hypothetical protein
MDDMPKYAEKHAERRSPVTPAAWLVLGAMGIASVTFQIDHALDGGLPRWLIAGVVGFAPVAVSLGVAHMIALHKGGRVMRAAAILVMACGMTLSMGAIAWVVGPYYHSWLRWLFGVLLDGAALFAAWVLLSEHERRAGDAAQARSAAEVVKAAEATAAEAGRKVAALEDELVTVKAALEAERKRRVPARKKRGTSARKPARASAAELVPVSAGSSAAEEMPDIDAEARILELIAKGMSASAAGIAAGKSDSYGRQVARLARAAQEEPRGDARTAGDIPDAPATGPMDRVTG